MFAHHHRVERVRVRPARAREELLALEAATLTGKAETLADRAEAAEKEAVLLGQRREQAERTVAEHEHALKSLRNDRAALQQRLDAAEETTRAFAELRAGPKKDTLVLPRRGWSFHVERPPWKSDIRWVSSADAPRVSRHATCPLAAATA